jgi:hypothetical protein
MAITLTDNDGPKFLELLREVLTGATTPQVRQTALRFLELVYSGGYPENTASVILKMPYSSGTVSVSRNDYETMVRFAGEGKKIQAIKVLRECSGIGLKEAKDFIEQSEQFKAYWQPSYARH